MRTALVHLLLLTAGLVCVASVHGQKISYPREQIALQLGAIQMGYATPFNPALTIPEERQLALNALAQGRNALRATSAKPTVNIQDFQTSPPVGSLEFREQLDQAVENVVALSFSPPRGRISGRVTLADSGKRSQITASLRPVPADWTIPLPYAVASKTGGDGQPGPAGPIGPTGPPGPVGQTGPAGILGPAGPTGATGGVGLQGPTGATGPAGASGLPGSQGPAGPVGPKGDLGVKGDAGVPGPQGPAGPTGGTNPTYAGEWPTIGGGAGNSALADYATIGGGLSNSATNISAGVFGGQANTAGGLYSFIGGGSTNLAAASFAVLGGGLANTITDAAVGATIAGGQGNNATDFYAAIAGGFFNTAGDTAAVGGGQENRASGAFSTIPGGRSNVVSGANSFAAGIRAMATNDYSFVWGGSPDVDTVSTTDGQYVSRAPGGVIFLTSTHDAAGIQLAANGSSWGALSDSNAKTDIQPIDHRQTLTKLAGLPVTRWRYKHDPTREYIGPMAQDFHAAFGLGHDDRRITTLDTDGVTLSAIKGLVEELRAQEAALAERERRIEALENEVEAIRERIGRNNL